MGSFATGVDHVDESLRALAAFRHQVPRVERWGEHLAAILSSAGRLLVAGNGGSAAEAQHLTAELVGRYHDERQPLSAIALHAETSSLTAIANDYGLDHAFRRQVLAHGRPGDVFLGISTSGRSTNVLAAAEAARATGLEVWALTGPRPNPLDAIADEALCIQAASTAAVQEVHLVAVHVLCAAVDVSLGAAGVPAVASSGAGS
jgi:D-sedoheptulose 7-phosphate isomerase